MAIKVHPLNKAEDFQKIGDYYYKLAADKEDKGAPQSEIDASWKASSINYWEALSLGGEKAAISLFKNFGQGVGVEKDIEIATLMYGVAQKLTPEECIKIPEEYRPPITKDIQSKVDILTKLVQDTKSKLPAKGITMDQVVDQMDNFDKAIRPLIGEKSISNLLKQGMGEVVSDSSPVVVDGNHYANNIGPVHNDHHEVKHTGDDSSSCFSCILM